jgi:hypothetical protein
MPRLAEPDARSASVLVDELDAGGSKPDPSPLVFPQPDSRTSAVGVDELDPCFFEGATDRSVIWCGQRSLIFTKLSAPAGGITTGPDGAWCRHCLVAHQSQSARLKKPPVT